MIFVTENLHQNETCSGEKPNFSVQKCSINHSFGNMALTAFWIAIDRGKSFTALIGLFCHGGLATPMQSYREDSEQRRERASYCASALLVFLGRSLFRRVDHEKPIARFRPYSVHRENVDTYKSKRVYPLRQHAFVRAK